jgi:hypothetical protein
MSLPSILTFSFKKLRWDKLMFIPGFFNSFAETGTAKQNKRSKESKILIFFKNISPICHFVFSYFTLKSIPYIQ